MPNFCRTCGAPVEWAVTEKGKKMPVDVQRRPDGNIVLAHKAVGQPPIAVVKTKEQIDQLRAYAQSRDEELELYVSHFATCEFAGEHRKS